MSFADLPGGQGRFSDDEFGAARKNQRFLNTLLIIGNNNLTYIELKKRK